MATSIIRDDVFIWGNLLTASVVFQALTWVFQIMPLFFFAGVAASVEVVAARRQLGRLADAALHPAVPPGVLLPGVLGCRAGRAAVCPARTRLRAGRRHLDSAALVPWARTSWCWRRCRCWPHHHHRPDWSAASAATYAVVAVVDVVRINVDGLSGLGYLNIVGVAHPRHVRRGLPTRAARRRAALHARRGDARRQRRADVARALRAEPGRHREPAAAEHDSAVAAAGRSRNHDVRVRDCRRTRDRAVGAAATGVVAGGDRQLGCDDAVPVAHAGAAGDASGLRLPRLCRAIDPSAATSSRSQSCSW